MSFKSKNKLKEIWANSKYIFLYNIFERLTFFAFYISIARYVDKELYGLIVSAFAFINILAAFIDFGLPIYIQRETASGKLRIDQLINAISFKLLLMIFFIPVPLVYFKGDRYISLIIVLISLINFIYSILQILIFYLNGKHKFAASFYSIFYSRLILFSLLIYFTIMRMGVYISLSFLFLILVFQAIYLIEKIKEFKLKDLFTSLDFGVIKNLIKSSFPFALSVIFVMTLERIDILILQSFRGYGNVAVYSVASSLFRQTSIISSIFFLQSFNFYSKIYTDFDKEIFVSQLKVDSLLLLSLGIFTAVCFQIFGEFLVKVLFGIKFLESVVYLKQLAFAIPLIFIVGLNGVLLNSFRREKINMFITFLAVILNFILNLIFIRYYGISGAVMATILTYIAVLIFQVFYLAGFVRANKMV